MNAAVRTSSSSDSRRAFNAADAGPTSSPSASRRATISSRASARASGAASESRSSTARSTEGSTRTGRDRAGSVPVRLSKLERAILHQDRPLEQPQRGGRLDPELLDERLPSLPIDGQRVGLPARPVEREHQLLAEPLAEGMGSDELLQLADELRMSAQREVRVDPPFDRREPDLLEPLDRRPRERLVREVGQRSTAPEAERRSQELRGLLRVPSATRLRRSLRQPLEAVQVELVGSEAQDVSRRTRLDHRYGKDAAQLGDLALHLRDGRDGGGAAIEVVGETLDRNDPVGPEQEDGEGGALFRPTERDGAVTAHDL